MKIIESHKNLPKKMFLSLWFWGGYLKFFRDGGAFWSFLVFLTYQPLLKMENEVPKIESKRICLAEKFH